MSSNMLKSVGKYQKRCEDLLRVNISRRAKIFWQIPEHVRRSGANISRGTKIFWQISAGVQRSLGKYQWMCKDLWANISRRAKIFGQILVLVRRSVGQSVDARRSKGKYLQKCKDLLWANIIRCSKICGPISADKQRSVGKLQQTCENMW
jgi:hypothetical protein